MFLNISVATLDDIKYTQCLVKGSFESQAKMAGLYFNQSSD